MDKQLNVLFLTFQFVCIITRSIQVVQVFQLEMGAITGKYRVFRQLLCRTSLIFSYLYSSCNDGVVTCTKSEYANIIVNVHFFLGYSLIAKN